LQELQLTEQTDADKIQGTNTFGITKLETVGQLGLT